MKEQTAQSDMGPPASQGSAAGPIGNIFGYLKRGACACWIRDRAPEVLMIMLFYWAVEDADQSHNAPGARNDLLPHPLAPWGHTRAHIHVLAQGPSCPRARP